jgi:hypothetical protein
VKNFLLVVRRETPSLVAKRVVHPCDDLNTIHVSARLVHFHSLDRAKKQLERPARTKESEEGHVSELIDA